MLDLLATAVALMFISFLGLGLWVAYHGARAMVADLKQEFNKLNK
jgi:hypothetical protein